MRLHDDVSGRQGWTSASQKEAMEDGENSMVLGIVSEKSWPRVLGHYSSLP